MYGQLRIFAALAVAENANDEAMRVVVTLKVSFANVVPHVPNKRMNAIRNPLAWLASFG